MDGGAILLLGDDSAADYHPLGAVEAALRGILGAGGAELLVTEDRTSLDRIEDFDLCVLYVDRWKERLGSGPAGRLLSYVQGGGGMLALHNGISAQSDEGLANLIGARFTGHPERETLRFSPALGDDPLGALAEGIELFEEPYRFAFDPACELEVIARYRGANGIPYPAAWRRDFGRGRFAFLMPGHDAASFLDPGYARLVAAAADWASRKDLPASGA